MLSKKDFKDIVTAKDYVSIGSVFRVTVLLSLKPYKFLVSNELIPTDYVDKLLLVVCSRKNKSLGYSFY